MRFLARELSTVLAALRFWQRTGLEWNLHHGLMELSCPEEERNIATQGETDSLMEPNEIDELCGRIST